MIVAAGVEEMAGVNVALGAGVRVIVAVAGISVAVAVTVMVGVTVGCGVGVPAIRGRLHPLVSIAMRSKVGKILFFIVDGSFCGLVNFLSEYSL